MKKCFGKHNIIIYIMIVISLIIFDYINLPSLLGLNMFNVNWDFCMGILNIFVVIILYVLTYKKLDERTIEREKNKMEISILLLNQCYKDCIKYVELINKETVEKYIVPKLDFNSNDNKIIDNLAYAPFENENIIMDLVKDGQITRKRIEMYFNIKNLFIRYIQMRIICYDGPDIYEPLKSDLLREIDKEIKNLN